jgi:hypothetical protein
MSLADVVKRLFEVPGADKTATRWHAASDWETDRENDRSMLEEAAAQLLVSDTWFFWWD